VPKQKKSPVTKTEQAPEPARYRVRLPGFIPDDRGIGLGDAITRATYRVGIRSCAGCAKRAAKLNRWVVFTR
jgi:hypothetical protein